MGRAVVPPTRALCGALGSRSVPPLGGTLGVSQPPAPLRAGPPSADDDHSGARQCWHSHAITHYPRTDTPADFKRARRSKHVHTRTRVLTKNERMQSARQGAGGCTCMLKPRAVCVCVCVYVCTRRVRQERGSRGSTLSPASRRSPLCLPHTHTHADIHTCVCVCVCVCLCVCVFATLGTPQISDWEPEAGRTKEEMESAQQIIMQAMGAPPLAAFLYSEMVLICLSLDTPYMCLYMYLYVCTFSSGPFVPRDGSNLSISRHLSMRTHIVSNSLSLSLSSNLSVSRHLSIRAYAVSDSLSLSLSLSLS